MTSSAGEFLSVRFSTDSLPRRDRLDFVREVIGRTLMRIDIAPPPDGSFHWQLNLQAMPGLGMISGVNTAMRVERTPRLLMDGSDDLLLAIQRSGTRIMTQCGRETTIGAGGAVLLSLAQSGSSMFPEASRMTTLKLPRAALEPLVVDIDDAVMRPLAKDDEALRLLASYLRELENGDALKTLALRRLAIGHIYDLVALVLGARRDAVETARAGGLRAARLRSIVDAIHAGFADPAFSVQRIAPKVGISPRYIQDLLHEAGASFSARVLDLRLRQAHKMLADPRHARLKIIEIAYACGFNEVSYFNRCFLRRFGASPTELRRGDGAPCAREPSRRISDAPRQTAPDDLRNEQMSCGKGNHSVRARSRRMASLQ